MLCKGRLVGFPTETVYGLGGDATNERAIRCYRACGFVEEGRLRQHDYSDGAYVDVVAMGILRDEWGAARERRT